MYHPISKYCLLSAELMEKVHYIKNALRISKGKINMSWAYDKSNTFEAYIYLQNIQICFQSYVLFGKSTHILTKLSEI